MHLLRVTLLDLFLLSLFVPGIFSENEGKFSSLHSSREFRITLPDAFAFQDIRINDSKLKDFVLEEPNRLGLNTDQLLKLFTHAATDKCFLDLNYTVQNIWKPDVQQPWAIRFFDSYGKLGSGILNGNTKFPGDYNECINIYAPPHEKNPSIGNFHGQYCTMQLSVNLSGIVFSPSFGVCLPDSCNSATLFKDLWKLLNATGLETFVERFENTVNFTSLNCKPISKQYTSTAIFMIYVLAFFGLLSFIGSSITAYEYAKCLWRSNENDKFGNDNARSNELSTNAGKIKNSRENISTDKKLSNPKSGDSSNRSKSFFKCFCVFTNGQKVLDTSATADEFLSIHGIKFIVMCWVIICHVYIAHMPVINNIHEVPDLVDSWPFFVIVQGFYSVDSSFLLSGFLMAFLFYQEYEKKRQKIPWLKFYLHRYIRLTPMYVILIGVYSVLFTHMGSGPFWPDYEVEPYCQESWWWNLLYINNFISMSKQCVPWCWYLANDMQFFIISPLYLITLYRWPKMGFLLLGLSICGSSATTFGITYHYDLITGFDGVSRYKDIMTFSPDIDKFFDYVYIKPYTRISPYLLGIALGYYLFNKKKQSRIQDSRLFLACGWFLSTAVGITMIYIVYHQDLSLLQKCFYNSFNRICFTACLSWVLYACLTGQGGPVNAFLSYKLFMPLSRLTYAANLFHPLVVSGFLSSLKSTIPFSHITVVTLFIGLLVITYAVSFIASLVFESPIIQLEKFLRGKKKTE